VLILGQLDLNTRHVRCDFAKRFQEAIAGVRFQFPEFASILKDQMSSIGTSRASAFQGIPESIKITSKGPCIFCTDRALISIPEFFDVHNPVAIYDQSHRSNSLYALFLL